MSQRKSNVDKFENYIDTKYSSGDSNRMNMKQSYQEENNNEIDELSKELSEMGCIVDAVKRPPNICVESCVHSDVVEPEENENSERVIYEIEEDAYSDEFEDDNSDNEVSIATEIKSVNSESPRGRRIENNIKLTKSQSSLSTHRPAASASGRSSYGSISVPQTRRINMSFTNDRLREIERHNHILLNKILSVRNKKTTVSQHEQKAKKSVPSAAVQRKQYQRKIDHDNMILLRKIQRAKSSSCSFRH